MKTHERVRQRRIRTTPEERQFQAWCGQEILAILREMFDDHQLGRHYRFDAWVDAAPIPPAGKRAIALARAAAARRS